MSNLRNFVKNWNGSGATFICAAHYDVGSERPTTIELRYAAAAYQKLYNGFDAWEVLCDTVEAKSHHTIYVATSYRLFQGGILDLKVASQSIRYHESLVIGTLEWIDEFFRQNTNNGLMPIKCVM